MIGQFGYWDAVAWSGLFALFTAMAWLLLNSGKPRKAKQFLCGEEIPYATPSQGFYSGFEEALGGVFKALVAYQSGVVSDYIAYAVIFTSIVALLVAGGILLGLA